MNSPCKWKNADACRYISSLNVPKDGVVCQTCRRDISRVLLDPQHTPRWAESRVTEYCVVVGCTEAAFSALQRSGISDSFTALGLESTVAPIPTPTPLCQHHYHKVYQYIQPIQRHCITCGSALRRDSNPKLCPNPEKIQKHLEEHAGFEGKIGSEDKVCHTCYRSHLFIIQEDKNTSHDCDLQELISELGNSLPDSVQTVEELVELSLKSVAIDVGKELLNRGALLLPDTQDMFISVASASAHQLQGDVEITKLVTSQYILSYLTCVLRHHMVYECKVRKFGTLLYRPGSDLTRPLTQALWKVRQAKQASPQVNSTKTLKEESAEYRFLAELNLRACKYIQSFLSHNTKHSFELSDTSIRELIGGIDPILWESVGLLTKTPGEKANIALTERYKHTRVIRRFFVFCAMMFCINDNFTIPMHTLLTSIIDGQGGSASLIRVLNRLGVCASKDTLERHIQQKHADRDTLRSKYLDSESFTIVSADNIDFRHSYARISNGTKNSSWHGTSIQVVQPLPSLSIAPSDQSLSGTPIQGSQGSHTLSGAPTQSLSGTPIQSLSGTPIQGSHSLSGAPTQSHSSTPIQGSQGSHSISGAPTQSLSGAPIQSLSGTPIQGSQGSHSLSGTPTQSLSGAPIQSLSGTPIQGSQGSHSLSGTPTQSLSGTPIQGSQGSHSLSGAPIQSLSGTPIQGSQGSHSLSGTPIQGSQGSHSLSGTPIQGSQGSHSLSGTPIQGSQGSHSLSGAPTQSLSGTPIQGSQGSHSLSGAPIQSLSGTPIQGSQGSHSLSGTPIQGSQGSHSLSGTPIQGSQGSHSLSGTPIQGSQGSHSLSGAPTQSLSGTPIQGSQGSHSLSGAPTQSLSGTPIQGSQGSHSLSGAPIQSLSGTPIQGSQGSHSLSGAPTQSLSGAPIQSLSGTPIQGSQGSHSLSGAPTQSLSGAPIQSLSGTPIQGSQGSHSLSGTPTQSLSGAPIQSLSGTPIQGSQGSHSLSGAPTQSLSGTPMQGLQSHASLSSQQYNPLIIAHHASTQGSSQATRKRKHNMSSSPPAKRLEQALNMNWDNRLKVSPTSTLLPAWVPLIVPRVKANPFHSQTSCQIQRISQQ